MVRQSATPTSCCSLPDRQFQAQCVVVWCGDSTAWSPHLIAHSGGNRFTWRQSRLADLCLAVLLFDSARLLTLEGRTAASFETESTQCSHQYNACVNLLYIVWCDHLTSFAL